MDAAAEPTTPARPRATYSEMVIPTIGEDTTTREAYWAGRGWKICSTCNTPSPVDEDPCPKCGEVLG